MSRTSRVPYHQNVYDLLQLEPGESPEAARMIAAHEAQHGPLPASVKEWYLVPQAAPLASRTYETNCFWTRSNPPGSALDLKTVLDRAAHPVVTSSGAMIGIMETYVGEWPAWWMVDLGRDNPMIWRLIDDPDGIEPERSDWNFMAWRLIGDPDGIEPERSDWNFSEFVAEPFFEKFRQLSASCPVELASGEWPDGSNGRNPLFKRFRAHANGLWLRTPDEPFHPPVIDYLTEQFGESERTPRSGHVTTYTFRPPGGTIRITADEPELTGGLSAWWVHTETPERLAEFAALLVPWGTLRDTLRADTEAARGVLQRVRG
ncbi:hypothetical protein [Frigoriglobus tundricola]|uniref:Uncharacterized protein n=1 Tax=Frigoriglobus tundricola TaxID=2774151 RepID=A0A6M5Z1S0_9BACT|nr:hypothetical protein [Frigoriglobus tundricola]QJW99122.1 hypothetical protein FTUN_6720 [Frigoriglobus tundricola]